MPTRATKATIPESGRARYFRYLVQRCLEHPQLLADGARALVSPHMSYLDVTGGVDRSVLILSSQRSGSTLLGEVLIGLDRQRLIFEPFWGVAVGVSRNVPRGRFVDPGADDPELDRVMRTVLSGRIRNLWVDRGNTSRLPRGRVIKDCYGTNLAPYVARHLPEVPLIYLLRHPVATAYSVVALGWEDELDVILDQHDLIEEHFGAQATLIDSLVRSDRPSIPSLVLRWCLENTIPLTMLRRGAAHIVFYENLTGSGEAELERLATFLSARSPGLWSAWVPDPARLEKPSATAWRDGDRPPSLDQRRRGWQDAVSDRELAQSMEILNAFGLEKIYGPGPDPLLHADEVLLP